jgi:hypothetical protein
MKLPTLRWFEYHCYEGEDSADAELWHHTHQRVSVLKIKERGGGETPDERAENGWPRTYLIRFSDGFAATAFEDELVTDKTEYFRPDYLKGDA